MRTTSYQLVKEILHRAFTTIKTYAKVRAFLGAGDVVVTDLPRSAVDLSTPAHQPPSLLSPTLNFPDQPLLLYPKLCNSESAMCHSPAHSTPTGAPRSCSSR